MTLLQKAVLRELPVLVEMESLPEYVNLDSFHGSDTCIFRCSRGHNKGQVLPILAHTPVLVCQQSTRRMCWEAVSDLCVIKAT
jgi:hypothetical protein